MSNSYSDREQVLLAMVAAEDGRLASGALLKALDRWADEPHANLLDILVHQGALSADEADELLSACAAPLPSSIWQSIETSGALRAALEESRSRERQPARGDGGFARDQVDSHRPIDAPRFDVGAPHAMGGLGEVLRATDRQLNRQVAVKRIRTLWADDPAAQARFWQEARITGRLEHPGIVPVYALGRGDDRRPYYAMRFIAGESLEQAIERYYRQPTHERVAFNNLLKRLVDVCNTVEYAHSRGVIHRDLKPANIMLGPYGETIVVDWGLAAESADVVAHTSTAVGTPQYMSPEQARGEAHGPASDVYNLGASLYHLLTGRPPFAGRDSEEVVQLARDGRFERPRAVRPGIAKPLEAICLRAMESDPAERYDSAAALARDLERWLADEPVRAYQESTAARAARWMRHHQAQVAAAGVAGILLLVGLTLAVFAWSHFERTQYAARLELATQDRARLAELAGAAESARELTEAELKAGRFASALGVLNRAVDSLSEEPRLAETSAELAAMRDRLHRIVDFQQLSARSDALNYRGRSSEALVLSQTALDSLDVLNRGDWWSQLPAADLTPLQTDELTWNVYRELIKLSGLYALAVQEKMADVSSNPVVAMLSDAGREEAAAVQAVDALVQRFRPSEANRWIAGLASLRLGMPGAVSPKKLQPPQNAADATAIGMNCILAFDSPQYPFQSYRGNSDSLTSAAEAFRLASELDPRHHGTHLFLGFAELSLAQRAIERGEGDAHLHFAAARQALGRCIALRPDNPFAYAERSVAYWREAAALAGSGEETDEAQIAQLRELAVRDAQHARELDPENSWMHWYEGHAVQEIGQHDTAARLYLQAIRLGWDFGGHHDQRVVKGEELRAIPEARAWSHEQVAQAESEPLYEVLLAAALLAGNSPQLDEALLHADRACQCDVPPEFALSVRGMIHFERGEADLARIDFERAFEQNPEDIWAAFGVADCHALAGRRVAALANYEAAVEVASSAEHRAAADLGRCRMLLYLDRPAEAAAALRRAMSWQGSCNTVAVAKLAQQRQADEVLTVLAATTPHLIDRLVGEDDERTFQTLPLGNGGFELGLARYWGNAEQGGSIWWAHDGSRAAATTDSTRPHSGRRSLAIDNPGGAAGGRATTAQTIPAAAGTRYRLRLWAAAEGLARGGLRIEIDELDPPLLVELPEGTYDWTELTAPFETPAGESVAGRPSLAPLTVRITSAGAGAAWLDDLEIEQVSGR